MRNNARERFSTSVQQHSATGNDLGPLLRQPSRSKALTRFLVGWKLLQLPIQKAEDVFQVLHVTIKKNKNELFCGRSCSTEEVVGQRILDRHDPRSVEVAQVPIPTQTAICVAYYEPERQLFRSRMYRFTCQDVVDRRGKHVVLHAHTLSKLWCSTRRVSARTQQVAPAVPATDVSPTTPAY